MSVKLTSLKCPDCGAQLTIEEGRTQCFCTYCGAKIIITNENEHIYRNIDEAGIKREETNRIVKLKRLELAEKAQKSYAITAKVRRIISIVLGLVGIVCMFIGYNNSGEDSLGYIMVGMICLAILIYMWLFIINMNEDRPRFDGKIKVPDSVSKYSNKDYEAIKAMLQSAGFTNISCVPLYDLKVGLFSKPGYVESITIGGGQNNFIGKCYDPDEPVVIAYHSMAKQ